MSDQEKKWNRLATAIAIDCNTSIEDATDKIADAVDDLMERFPEPSIADSLLGLREEIGNDAYESLCIGPSLMPVVERRERERRRAVRWQIRRAFVESLMETFGSQAPCDVIEDFAIDLIP